MFQVTQKDSGTTLATMTNPNIVDEKCDRGRCSICEVAAPVRRVIIRGLCQLSIFNRSLKHLLTGSCWLCFTMWSSHGYFLQSLQLHHQWGRATNVCWKPHFRSLLQQNNERLGVVRPIVYQQIIWFWQYREENIQRTTLTWCHRYDRKDPSVVAISLSPEETLLLGFFFLPKNCSRGACLHVSGVHFRMFKGFTLKCFRGALLNV